MKSIINVTNNAWKKMRKIVHSTSSKNEFLYSVTTGGCNGFNFNLELLKKEEKDEILKLKPNVIINKGVHLYVEPMSEMYLIGTTIDYIEEDFSKGIFENKFVYKIDKEKGTTCGCGVSFMPRNVK